MNYGVVLVTASSQSEAEKIASVLVEMKLAACVSLMPIHSIYRWQGEIHKDQEWQLIIKTDLGLFSNLETQVQELHSYEVPEIIALPIVAGSEGYLQWMGEECRV